MTTQRFRFRNYDVNHYSDIEWATPRGATRVRRLEDGRIEVIFEDEETTVIVNDLSELNKEINKSFEEQSEADTTPLESRKALSKQELVKFLIDNYTNENGDLDLTGLDFSEFDGDVYISHMKVKKDLLQECHQVEGVLYQGNQKVKGSLLQEYQEVEGVIWQGNQKSGGSIYQSRQQVGYNLCQYKQEVKGDLLQCDQKVKKNLHQDNQNVGGNLYQDNRSVGEFVYPEKGVE